MSSKVSITRPLTLELLDSRIDFAQLLCGNFNISSMQISIDLFVKSMFSPNNLRRNREQTIPIDPVVPASKSSMKLERNSQSDIQNIRDIDYDFAEILSRASPLHHSVLFPTPKGRVPTNTHKHTHEVGSRDRVNGAQ